MNRSILGGLSIIFAVFLMAAQDTAIKIMSTDVSFWQLSVVRAPLAFVLLTGLALLLPRTSPGQAWRSAFEPWAMVRAFFLLLMYIFLYLSFPYLKLAEMGAAFYTAPIFTALMSALFLRERVGWQGWMAVLLGFIGVLVVSRPGTGVFTPAIAFPVISGFCYSVAAVLTRAKVQGTDTLGVALSMNVIIFVFAILIVAGLTLFRLPPETTAIEPFLLNGWMPMTVRDWIFIPSLAFLICGLAFFMPLAYQIAPPVLVATLEYVYLIYAGLMGFFLLDETLDGISILGMAILVAAGLLIVFRKQPAPPQAAVAA